VGHGLGAIQAAAPLGFWWLDPATVYRLSLTLIAAVYIGFAVADGRPRVIAVEVGIAAAFVVVAAAGVTGPAWLLVVGLAGHGFKDLWQHRRQQVANTCWWPPTRPALPLDHKAQPRGRRVGFAVPNVAG